MAEPVEEEPLDAPTATKLSVSTGDW